jgi:hypothetical protein
MSLRPLRATLDPVPKKKKQANKQTNKTSGGLVKCQVLGTYL